MKAESQLRGTLLRKVLNSLALLAVLGVGELTARAAGPPAGIAPVDPPFGGFAIDGNLCANTPGTNSGDWCVTTNFPGSGGGVLNAAGVLDYAGGTDRISVPTYITVSAILP